MSMASGTSLCHVFLSFKGNQIRNKFTFFLYEALKAKGFVAFMDKCDVHVGDEIDFKIKEGIRKSMSAIIIFSQHYAYSTWCLDELVLILERKKNSRYFIIPIFYEVETRDIKHQLGNYGRALEHHRALHSDKIEKWREALVEVGNILGEHVHGPHNIFIRNIVKIFRKQLAANFPECRLPERKINLERMPSQDNVIVYTISGTAHLSTNRVVKLLLNDGNIVIYKKMNGMEERKYLKKLQELAGNYNVRPPTMIVNGKDMCGKEEVDGLDIFEDKQKLIDLLKNHYMSSNQFENLEDMLKALRENPMGLLRIRIKKGVNLAVRDLFNTSDPYVVVKMGTQKLKTRVIKKDVNPEWNEDLIFSVQDPKIPVKLAVYDEDSFTMDDKMGEAEFSIKEYFKALKIEVGSVPDGTVITSVYPSRSNCVAQESHVIFKDGQFVQKMCLRLYNVECGEIELELHWIDLPGVKSIGY